MPGGGFLLPLPLRRSRESGNDETGQPALYFTYMLCLGALITRITIGSKKSSGAVS